MLLLGSLSTGWACTVPVFRFALEQWPTDQFEVALFYNGPLTADQKALLKKIQPRETENSTVPNMRIHQVDLAASPDPRWVRWWDEHKPKNVKGPHLVFFYPASTMKMTPMWMCEFKAELIDQALRSPARKKLADQLRAGESVVWVLLESGDQKKDAAAKQLLDTRLAHLAKTLKLPKVKTQDIQAGYLSIRPEDLKLSFSVLTLRAGDAKETVFREMLLNSEEDLKKIKEPMAFPVFGRGRALNALVGKGINKHMIDEASTFLTGPCSCQVKRQNPGFDLLTSVDWDQLILAQIREYDDRAQTHISVETQTAEFESNHQAEPTQSTQEANTPTASEPTAPPMRALFGWLPLVGFPILIVGSLIIILSRKPE